MEPEFKVACADFDKSYESAKKWSLKGRADRVIASFGEYINVEYWVDRIAILIKQAYLEEIKNSVSDFDEIDWERTLTRYIERFSADEELERILIKFKLKNKLDQLEVRGDMRGYRYKNFLETLLVYKK